MIANQNDNTEEQNLAEPGVDESGNDNDELLYEEPPLMTPKDSMGVAVAVVALVVIGILGYNWLTPNSPAQQVSPPASTEPEVIDMPDLNMADMDIPEHDMAGMESNAESAEESSTMEELPSTSGEQTPNQHDHKMNCAYCGMFSDKSKSHIQIKWSDESHTHHDCWDCAFFYGSEEGLSLEAAEVTLLSSPVSNPVWIDAEDAWYLYDTEKSVEGSMQPFVAAFESMDAAHASHSEWGGELVDFAGLQAKWH